MSGAPAPATLDVGTDVALAEEPYRGGRLRAAAARLLGQRVACGALCILVLLHVVVFVGPLIWRVSPDSADPLAALSGLEAQHPLGADHLGRDELSRMLAGGQVTLVVGLVAMAFLVVVGVAVGAAAAFVGGWVDAILMRLTDAMMAVPGFFFVLVALTVLPKAPIMVALVIGGASWMEVTRVIQGGAWGGKAGKCGDAPFALGAPRGRFWSRHIRPHTAPAII